MTKLGHRGLLVVGAVAMLALGACREEEQDRILLFEKGTYLGAPDTPLGDDSSATLRQRASGQQF